MVGMLMLVGCSSKKKASDAPVATSSSTSVSASTSAAASSSAATSESASASSDSSPASAAAPTEKVSLTFWSWVPKIDEIVKVWNSKNPDIQVKVDTTAQGDALVTKLLTADRAGKGPDMFQAEYQALPALVSADVAGDITKEAASVKDSFPEGAWNAVSFNGATYAVPQDIGPMAFFYREDLFKSMGLNVPTTWDEYATLAAEVRKKDPKKYLGSFSSTDPGWFAGLSQQNAASWWAADGDAWQVSVNDEASKKVASYWGDLVKKGDILGQPFFTPEFNKALNDGTLLSWPVAVWGSQVIGGNAPDTKGKWRMAPMPDWTAGAKSAGYWGGSATAVSAKSKNKEAATKFANWLNSDPEGIGALIKLGGLYPAATSGQSSPEFAKAPEFFPNQPDFYTLASDISKTAKGFTFGPNVNVTYNSYRDAFGKAIKNKSDFAAALDEMNKATIADLKKTGFTVKE
ncbi:MAG: extracellular solute-binding protein [Actinomycetota bacterium]